MFADIEAASAPFPRGFLPRSLSAPEVAPYSGRRRSAENFAAQKRFCGRTNSVAYLARLINAARRTPVAGARSKRISFSRR